MPLCHHILDRIHYRPVFRCTVADASAPPSPESSQILVGTTYTISDAFTDTGHGTGTHWHSSNDPAKQVPPALGAAAAGTAEVGGFFGDESPRGISEFDINGKSKVRSAKLKFRVFDIQEAGLSPDPVGGLYGQETGGVGPYEGTIEVYAFVANQIEQTEDYGRSATLIGTFDSTGLAAKEFVELDITDHLNSEIEKGSAGLGVRLQITPEDPNESAITFELFSIETVIEAEAIASWGWLVDPEATYLVDETNVAEDCNWYWSDGAPNTWSTGEYATWDCDDQTDRVVQPGRCLSFDGVDDYAWTDANSNFDAQTGESITYMIWSKSSAASSSGGARLIANGTNHILFGREATFIRGAWRVYPSGSMQDTGDGEWAHLAIVFDDNAQTLDIYKNGVLWDQMTGITGSIGTPGTLVVGRQGTSGNTQQAELYDARVYHRSLTASEIKKCYDRTLDQPVDTELHAKLDEGAGLRAFDSSGNGRVMSLVNGPSWDSQADLPYSWSNDGGYTPGNYLEGTATSDIALPSSAVGVSTKIEFQVYRLPGSFVFASDSDGSANYAFAGADGSSSTTLTANAGSPSLYVDDVLFTGTTRDNLYDAVPENQWSTIRIESLDTSSWSGVQLSYGGSGFDFNGVVKNIKVNDAAIPQDDLVLTDADFTAIPRDESNPNFDVSGADLDYSGKASKPSIFKQSNCLNFNGVSQRVELSGRATSGTVSQLTASCWFRSDTASTYMFFMAEYNNTGDNRSWYMGFNSSGVFECAVYEDGLAAGPRKIYRGGEYDDNQWHHAAMVFDNGELLLYVDGEEDIQSKPVDEAMSTIYDSSVKFMAGAGGTGTSFELIGDLCDCRLYSNALSASDIKKIFSQANDQPDADVIHWTMSEGAGTTTYNVVNNSNHGTLKNSPAWSLQDVFHWNITKGFRLSGGTRIPALADGSSAADGGEITNPADSGHNNAETLLDFTSGEPNAPYANVPAIDFNGTSSYGQSTGISTWSFPFSLSCWVRFDDVASNQVLMVGNDGPNPICGLALLNNKFIAYLSSTNFRYHSKVLSDSVWYHVTAVFPTQDAKDAQIYIDGTDNAMQASTHTGIALSFTRLRLGLNNSSTGDWLNGKLRHAKLFDSALTPAEAKKLYDGTLATKSPILHLPLNDGYQDFGKDISGNGYDATLVNTSWVFEQIPSDYAFGDDLPPWLEKNIASAVLENKFALRET